MEGIYVHDFDKTMDLTHVFKPINLAASPLPPRCPVKVD
jgi:hypothetical protein